MMLTPARNLNNLWHAVSPIGHTLFYVVIAGATLAYLYSRRRGWRTLDIWRLIVLLIYCLAGLLIVSSFMNVRIDFLEEKRHVFPISIALIPLWAAGLEQIIWTARDWFRQSRFPKWQWIAPVGAIALVSVALVPGYVNGNMNLIDRFSLVDIRPLLWRWSDINVPAEGRILMHPRSDLHLTWNREWGGYDGVQTFLWWHEDETAIAASTPEIYAERGIVYFALSEGDLVRFFNQPEMETFISRLTLVKTIPTGPGITGSSVYFYRMLPPQNPTDFTFSDQITLVGYDLTDTRLIPGDTITIRPYWRIQRQPETNYQMFIHLYSADDVNLLSQHDTQPASPQRPTLTWDDPSELYIGQDVPISIPVDLESGAYRLAIGLYDLNTFQRLVTTEGADFFEIPITIGDS
jgi:hypothetical protein